MGAARVPRARSAIAAAVGAPSRSAQPDRPAPSIPAARVATSSAPKARPASSTTARREAATSPAKPVRLVSSTNARWAPEAPATLTPRTTDVLYSSVDSGCGARRPRPRLLAGDRPGPRLAPGPPVAIGQVPARPGYAAALSPLATGTGAPSRAFSALRSAISFPRSSSASSGCSPRYWQALSRPWAMRSPFQL